ncbi:MAG: hypothetical protein Q9162_005688 [Coniocarpon cinnabarinum]
MADDDFRPTWKLKAAFSGLSVATLASAFDANSISVALPYVSLVDDDRRAARTCARRVLGWNIILARRNSAVASMAGRTIQGLGGGGMVVLIEVLITDLVPLRERGKWVGFIMNVWALGSVTGPVIGGAFAQNVTWRWVFWINLPFIGLSTIVILLFLRLQSRSNQIRERLGEIDYVGIVAFTLSTTAFLLSVTWGGVIFSWGSWHTLVPLIAGLCGLIGFAMYQKALTRATFIPLVIFSNWSGVLTYYGISIQGILLWGLLYYVPLYYQAVLRYNPILSGVALFPETFTIVPLATVAGWACSSFGRYRWALHLGWALATLGMGLLCLLDERTKIVQWIFLNIVVGIGTGLLFPSTVISVMASAPQEHIAIATGMIAFFRFMGEALGVAVGGAIFQNRLRILLDANPDLSKIKNSYSTDATTLIRMINALPEQSKETQALAKVFANAFTDVWIVMCALAATALASSFFVKEYSMDQALQTEQGFMHEGGSDFVDHEKSHPPQHDAVSSAPGVEVMAGEGRSSLNPTSETISA